MDVNEVLLLMIGIACALMAARQVRARAGYRGWLLVSTAVLVLLGALYLLAPERAGYVGLAAWALFVLLPILGSRQLQRLVGHAQYGRARRLAVGLAVLHPLDGWTRVPSLLAALELAQRGEAEAAIARLERLAASPSPAIARQARFHLQRARNDWAGLRRWIEEQATETGLARDPMLLAHYLRALGETGDTDRLLALLARHAPSLERAALVAERSMAYLAAFAFSGRVAATERVLAALFHSYGPSMRTFWLATAEAAAGDSAARARFESLATDQDALVRRAAENRLAHPLERGALAPESQRFLDELEQRMLHEERYAERIGGAAQRPIVTRALVAVNGAMFAVEALSGGTEDDRTLHALGAVFWPGFTVADWWRPLAATFLHVGPLHLTMNLLALLVLGPYLERALGRRRYLIVYLVSGYLSSLTVVAAAAFAGRPILMVGASGSIMGILGGTAAVLWRGWRSERARGAGRRLRGVALILGIQVIFDFKIPQISFTAHLAGLLVGFAACALMNHWSDAPAAR